MASAVKRDVVIGGAGFAGLALAIALRQTLGEGFSIAVADPALKNAQSKDPDEYAEFMREAPDFERMLVNSGLSLTKFWFSVTRSEQRTRFVIRQVDPVRQWKLSPMDILSLDKWEDYTEAKEAMFFYTDSKYAPWTVVKSNDKKRARLEAMRHILEQFDYDGKDKEVVGKPDSKIIGPPSLLSEQPSAQSFIRL